jgi:superfamily II DNA/RNA helicase
MYKYKCVVMQALAEMDLKDLMCIQTYAWPAIMRGQYTILVGPPRSGKTVGYIIPLVSFMLTTDVYSEVSSLKKGNLKAQLIFQNHKLFIYLFIL